MRHTRSAVYFPIRPKSDQDLAAELVTLFRHILDSEEWPDRALCAQTDPEAFFPERGCSTAEAKRICMACPVRTECLDYALEHGERFGVWGGLSERERRKLKPRQQEAA